MADKSIVDLPQLSEVTDATLIPVYQPSSDNPAQKMPSSVFRNWAEESAEQYVDGATNAAQRAENALKQLGDEAQIAQQAAVSASADAKRAKLYADQTEASVSGVASFNGRGGHVMPQTGDYTANMVGAMENKGNLSNYSTVLAAATLETRSGYSFFAVVDGGSLLNAPDAPFGAAETQYFVLCDQDARRRTILAFGYGMDRFSSRDIFDGNWLTKWIDYTTTDTAAPAGFGLGEQSGKATTDLNECTRSGWYNFGGGSANAPDSGGYWMRVSAYSENYVYQEIFRDTDKAVVTRFRVGGVWQPWEWENPPMQPGVEYRTTERYMGKPVYAQLVSFGALPNRSSKNVAHGIAGIDHVCGVYAEAKYPNDTSMAMIGWADVVNCFVTLISITVETAADRSGYNGYFTLKYTKRTD